ncbi:dihydrodipicolinate synthase family protein [Niallia circulans]|uniref:Dihydrodipicolinate synthase family protein n=1 Tax=Niallia circulans TaxID=1397 RepID=A0A553SH30_NIACI|nr:dihydrodipicolinate synthase family protein [Niallia circulans]TRZ36286.1 dihydrodipicolinate synthase family protein [Niallia circulans]
MTNPFIPFSIAMITPFMADGNLNLEGIPSLVEHYRKNKVPALLISGSTGEQHSMTIHERISLFHEVKKAAADDFLLYGGVASVLTKDTIELAVAAEGAGLNGIMLGFPPYLRISQQEAFHYVERICSHTSLPIMLYNNPPRTGFNLETETLISLTTQFPQIVALKEAGDPADILYVKQQLGNKFPVLSGSDLTIFENKEYGYDGVTSIVGNIIPNEMLAISQAINSGESDTAKAIFEKVKPLLISMLELGILRSIKFLLNEQGIHAGYCREPISTLSADEKVKLKSSYNTFLSKN